MYNEMKEMEQIKIKIENTHLVGPVFIFATFPHHICLKH